MYETMTELSVRAEMRELYRKLEDLHAMRHYWDDGDAMDWLDYRRRYEHLKAELRSFER